MIPIMGSCGCLLMTIWCKSMNTTWTPTACCAPPTAQRRNGECSMRNLTVALFAILACADPSARAQSSTYTFVRSDDPVQDRNAYLLTLINADAGVQKALATEVGL